jgi:hypothetical protein
VHLVPKVPVEVPQHDDLIGSAESALNPIFKWHYLLLQNPAIAILIVGQISGGLKW